MLLPMTDHINSAQEAMRLLVAENLKSIRKRRGLSQEALGALTGIHRTHIGLAERGATNLTLDNLTLLSLTLGVKVADLFNESPESVPPLRTGRPPKMPQATASAEKRTKAKE
jgi:transcriptional regulator with XRE-family HTH domain